MLGSIKYNLSHLTDFSGRDARQTFWYYVLFLVVIQFVLAMVAAIPMYIDMFTSAFDAARAGVDTDQTEAIMMGSMSGALEQQMWVGMVLTIVATLLFIAAFVRRLHDGGFSGWWAVVPLFTQVIALWVSFETIDMMQSAMGDVAAGDSTAMLDAQGEMLAYSVVGYIGYLVVIVFGVMKSQGPNQYGEESVSF